MIQHKNPDFVNIQNTQQLIEFYGDYWHRNDDPQDRINFFKSHNYDCIVIWEKELKNINQLITKLQDFNITI